MRFPLGDVTPRSRTAGGVRAVRLGEGDEVAGASIVDKSNAKKLVTITANGYGKLSEFSEYPSHNRGGKGVRCHNVTDKTGEVVGIATVEPADDIMLITDDGTVIRMNIAEIPIYSRTAGGVIVMRPAEGSEIVGFAALIKEIDEPEAEAGQESEEPVKQPERGEFDEGEDTPEPNGGDEEI